MNDLRKNEGLAQDIYKAISGGLTMFIGRDYFGDGVSYTAMTNPTTMTLAVQKLDRRNSSNLLRDLGAVVDVTPETIEAALNDMDGVPPLVRLSADIFVDLMVGVVQKSYPYLDGMIMVSVDSQDNAVNYRYLVDENGAKAIRCPRPADQPDVLFVLETLLEN